MRGAGALKYSIARSRAAAKLRLGNWAVRTASKPVWRSTWWWPGGFFISPNSDEKPRMCLARFILKRSSGKRWSVSSARTRLRRRSRPVSVKRFGWWRAWAVFVDARGTESRARKRFGLGCSAWMTSAPPGTYFPKCSNIRCPATELMGKDQRREREHRTPRCDEPRRSGLAKARRTNLPLPKREGWGEGEATLEKPMRLRTADELNDTGTVRSAIQRRDPARHRAFDSPPSGGRFSLSPFQGEREYTTEMWCILRTRE